MKAKNPRQNSAIVRHLVLGPIAVNCYIVTDPETDATCIIDPGAEPGKIKDVLSKNELKPQFIINTHGHGDHIAANGYFGVPVYIHRLDGEFLTNSELNLSLLIGFPIKSPKADRLLEDNDEIVLGSKKLKIVHTPGHTPGSISIKTGDMIFTGDTLFFGGVGRTDFPYSDEDALLNSVKRLLKFSDDDVIYPGHGESSSIGEERKSNPFCQLDKG